jgi:AraC family transcriptional regulator
MDVPAFHYLGDCRRQWQFGALSVTLTHYPPRQRQTRHRHENPTFFFLLQGAFADESDERGTLEPEPFDLLYHPAGSWHEGVSGDQGRLGLNLEPTEEWLSTRGLRPADLGPYRIEADPVRMCELLRLAMLSFEDSDVESLLLEILTPAGESKADLAWFRRIHNLVQSSGAARWTLQSMAAEVGVHPVYLARVFRARHGCSFTTFVGRRRMIHAARELAAGRKASEIAHELDFVDQSHFARTFRAWLRTTPAAFSRIWVDPEKVANMLFPSREGGARIPV